MKKFLLIIFLLLGTTSFILELTSSGLKGGVINKKIYLEEILKKIKKISNRF